MVGRIARMLGTAFVGLVAATAPLAVAQPAQAATVSPCTARTTTTPFTTWGDGNAYFTVPEGNFESGTSTWTTSAGVSRVSGNEPWKVLGSGHANSLKIPAGGSATTQSMCIATAEDSLRFFYKSPGVSGSLLHVSIYVTSGVNVATNDYDVNGSTAGWKVSDRIMLPDIRDASGQQVVKITFSQRQTAATWQLDDVEIDPWKTL